MNYNDIMYSVGQLVRCIYDDNIPVNIQNMIIRYPVRGIGLMNQLGDIIHADNQEEVMRIMNKIPHDFEDPKDKMEFSAQGAFWLGYYHYAKIKADVKNYGVNELAIIGRALYGEQWQTALSKALNLSSPRRVRAWISGERKIPMGIWFDIIELLKKHHLKISELIKQLS
jgi:hypothetical protein